MFKNLIHCFELSFRRRRWVRASSCNGDRPLNVAFVITSMPVGGAEVLLVNLVRRFDRMRIIPEIVCLKTAGPLGEKISNECTVTSGWLRTKSDFFVLPRLIRYFRSREIDAVITVGSGDKMFWGRLAARFAGVPAILSALHSTGWPDGVGRLNRMLTPITDGFIAVADNHAAYLRSKERFPGDKVFTIRNGVDTSRFAPSNKAACMLREELGISSNSHLIGIVAALRPEKNHEMFLRVAAHVKEEVPNVCFLIIGEGPQRKSIDSTIATLGLGDTVLCLGNRHDTERIIPALDLLLLCSDNEASPVSILEALACQVPVIATRVGSVGEMVVPDHTGELVDTNDDLAMSAHVIRLLQSPQKLREMGRQGRERVLELGSLEGMVEGYTTLVERLARGLPDSSLGSRRSLRRDETKEITQEPPGFSPETNSRSPELLALPGGGDVVPGRGKKAKEEDHESGLLGAPSSKVASSSDVPAPASIPTFPSHHAEPSSLTQFPGWS